MSARRDVALRMGSRAGVKLVLLENARHFLFEDEPERCAQEVIDFLRQAGI